MRGDQLAHLWRVLRVEASPHGLTAGEIAVREGHRESMFEKPFESLFQEPEWAFLFWGRGVWFVCYFFEWAGQLVKKGE